MARCPLSPPPATPTCVASLRRCTARYGSPPKSDRATAVALALTGFPITKNEYQPSIGASGSKAVFLPAPPAAASATSVRTSARVRTEPSPGRSGLSFLLVGQHGTRCSAKYVATRPFLMSEAESRTWSRSRWRWESSGGRVAVGT
eukprot:scaffold17254_cov99-Isochrysis_galbana.AAC.12